MSSSPAGEQHPPDTAVAASEPRQRWRVVFARPDGTDERTHREIAEAWTASLVREGLPLPRPAGRPRPALAFAAPLPVRVAALRELADLSLGERLPVWRVREAVTRAMPDGIELVDLHDVWLGTPALAASLVAADVRMDLAPDAPDRGTLAAAGRRLLAAPVLERERARGGGRVRYDLRPLVADVTVSGEEDGTIVRVRLRFDPERGAGRPEEIIAALEDLVAGPIPVLRTTRERLLLVGE